MTIKAATEEALGELHNKVAKIMSNALDVIETSQEVYLKIAEHARDNPDDLDLVANLPDKPPEASASLISVITKFLADNKISAVPEASSEVSALGQRLSNKNRRLRSVGNVTHLDASNE